MLPSKKAQAQKQEEEKEQRKTMNLESKRVEVQASQWAFFCEALSNDQEKISVVQKAPKKIREIQHLKAVQHRKSQESKAVQAVEGYMQNSIRILDTKNTAETVKETSDFARFIATRRLSNTIWFILISSLCSIFFGDFSYLSKLSNKTIVLKSVKSLYDNIKW